MSWNYQVDRVLAGPRFGVGLILPCVLQRPTCSNSLVNVLGQAVLAAVTNSPPFAAAYGNKDLSLLSLGAPAVASTQ